MTRVPLYSVCWASNGFVIGSFKEWALKGKKKGPTDGWCVLAVERLVACSSNSGQILTKAPKGDAHYKNGWVEENEVELWEKAAPSIFPCRKLWNVEWRLSSLHGEGFPWVVYMLLANATNEPHSKGVGEVLELVKSTDTGPALPSSRRKGQKSTEE